MTRPTPPLGYVWVAVLKSDAPHFYREAHLLTKGALSTAWQTTACSATGAGQVFTRKAADKKPGCAACLAAVAEWRTWAS